MPCIISWGDKMTITYLNADSVSMLEVIDGINHRKTYINSSRGREELHTEQPTEVVDEIMAIWGEAPTVGEELPDETEPMRPSLEERMSNQEQATLALMDTILMMNGGNGNV